MRPAGPFPRLPLIDRLPVLSLRSLFALFCLGLLFVIALKVLFGQLYAQLEARSANERARLFVGEEIVRGIRGIEKDVYRLATSANPAAVARVQTGIERQLRKLQGDLLVLRDGGVVRREAFLNLEGQDAMQQEVSYLPTPENSGLVMELIEIAPLLDQIGSKTAEIARLLNRRREFRETGQRDAFFESEQELSLYLKQVPPFFFRLDENANRLFHDSNERLRRLQDELDAQRRRLELAEMGLIGLVVVLAALAGLTFSRQIQEANRNLQQALGHMRDAKEEAERASRAKSNFVSRMSHELRTPMNAILGFAQLLEGEDLKSSHRNYVQLINRSGKHLLELINQVLDHAKIEAGHLELEEIEFELAALLDEVRGIFIEQASAKGLRFFVSIDAPLPPRLLGDPTRLRQVLINLIANAVKFTSRGEVELQVAAGGDTLLFVIRDTGIGMDEAVLARLFQPFAQADESTTRRYGGTGLGLLISRELVVAMGGEITVESAPGVGSRFSVRFPLRLPAASAPALLAWPAASPEAGQASDGALAGLFAGPLLLVDDNRINQSLAVAMLERLGLSCDTACDGLEALDCLAARNYALVLMDVEMPGLDGIGATRRWRESEAAKGGYVPIIAMTANALQEDRERCLAAGMDGYVPKPIDLGALEREIRRVLADRAAVVSAPPGAPAALAPLAGKDEGGALRRSAVFDRRAAAEMIDDEELLATLASMFVDEAPAYRRELEEALAAGDLARLRRAAHTLRSLFATFAAVSGQAAAAALESTAAGADLDACRALVAPVQREVLALAEALTELC